MKGLFRRSYSILELPDGRQPLSFDSKMGSFLIIPLIGSSCFSSLYLTDPRTPQIKFWSHWKWLACLLLTVITSHPQKLIHSCKREWARIIAGYAQMALVDLLCMSLCSGIPSSVILDKGFYFSEFQCPDNLKYYLMQKLM